MVLEVTHLLQKISERERRARPPGVQLGADARLHPRRLPAPFPQFASCCSPDPDSFSPLVSEHTQVPGAGSFRPSPLDSPASQPRGGGKVAGRGSGEGRDVLHVQRHKNRLSTLKGFAFFGLWHPDGVWDLLGRLLRGPGALGSLGSLLPSSAPQSCSEFRGFGPSPKSADGRTLSTGCPWRVSIGWG